MPTRSAVAVHAPNRKRNKNEDMLTGVKLSILIVLCQPADCENEGVLYNTC